MKLLSYLIWCSAFLASPKPNKQRAIKECRCWRLFSSTSLATRMLHDSSNMHLPQELLVAIVQCVRRKSDLVSLCLSSSALYQEASRHLYHELVLNFSGSRSGRRRAWRFLHTAGSNATLASYVVSVCLLNLPPVFLSSYREDWEESISSAFRSFCGLKEWALPEYFIHGLRTYHLRLQLGSETEVYFAGTASLSIALVLEALPTNLHTFHNYSAAFETTLPFVQKQTNLRRWFNPCPNRRIHGLLPVQIPDNTMLRLQDVGLFPSFLGVFTSHRHFRRFSAFTASHFIENNLYHMLTSLGHSITFLCIIRKNIAYIPTPASLQQMLKDLAAAIPSLKRLELSLAHPHRVMTVIELYLTLTVLTSCIGQLWLWWRLVRNFMLPRYQYAFFISR
jgi:hypothetical protein